MALWSGLNLESESAKYCSKDPVNMAEIGGWWLTCSERYLNPKSGLLYSKVSPNNGLNGLATLSTVEAYGEEANVAMYSNLSVESSKVAALSNSTLYSKSSANLCNIDVGSLNATGRAILVMSLPIIDLRIPHRPTLGLSSSFTGSSVLNGSS
ncbi:hypothetical protein WICPIJ_003380 [Wickerhamomyces pijperi]|uniref:Uncharacterized protein n=1 Tax=Wickerhamomyces pijperi TaxID=599730 RepID=A0A9P8Q7R1_WICPI|nr:hypothetical protein WICPIJ_003380 [Wickerhamomyces pijperi]